MFKVVGGPEITPSSSILLISVWMSNRSQWYAVDNWFAYISSAIIAGTVVKASRIEHLSKSCRSSWLSG